MQRTPGYPNRRPHRKDAKNRRKPSSENQADTIQVIRHYANFECDVPGYQAAGQG
jgi:hypothetical protein